jgi:hypothetical protein
MLRKIILIFITTFFLYSCGYSALYSNVNYKDINIKILEKKGDQEINNYLLSNLKKYSGNQGKTFLIKIDTNYSILDKSKNLEGSISDYQLVAVATFIVNKDNLEKTIIIKEDIIIKNLTDNFEKRNYEKSIKKNFSKSISNKLILQLGSIK